MPPIYELHPMLVHFPIAFFFLSFFFDLLWTVFRRRRDTDWLAKSGTLIMFLGIIAAVMAGLAGWISEHYVHWTATTAPVVNLHLHLAELTTTWYGLLWLWRIANLRKLTGWRFRVYMIGAIVGILLISYTGYLGGEMVYDLGVRPS